MLMSGGQKVLFGWVGGGGSGEIMEAEKAWGNAASMGLYKV